MTSPYPWAAAATNLWVTAVVVVVLFAGALLVATKIRHRHDGIDALWGAGYPVLAVVTFGLSVGEGDLWRRALITVLTVVWGMRLALHIARRNARHDGDDQRYVDIQHRAKGNPVLHLVARVYVTQAVLMWLVSLPVQLGQYGFASGPLVVVLTAIGVLFWAVGFFFETVGDVQLDRFKREPDSKGKVMDRGLWRYTRHPNYFGDAAVWWGLTVLALHHLPGLIGLLSAAVMTWLLAHGTGAKLLESSIGDRRPGYTDYVKRTSGFIPLPPRRRADA